MLSPQEIVSERNRTTAEQAAKLESSTNQKVMVEAIKQGFKEAIQELQGSTLKTRQLNIPAIQKVEGEVNIKNIPGLSELLGKLILTVANQEYPEMPEYPDVQKVEIHNGRNSDAQSPCDRHRRPTTALKKSVRNVTSAKSTEDPG